MGQALPATGDPLRLCLIPSGYSRRVASAISHSRAAAILLIPGKSHPPASECRQHGLICLGNCSVVRNRELLRSRKNLVTGAGSSTFTPFRPVGRFHIGFLACGLSKLMAEPSRCMFRRLTLNFHDDVAPTVVGLSRRASVASDGGLSGVGP